MNDPFSCQIVLAEPGKHCRLVLVARVDLNDRLRHS